MEQENVARWHDSIQGGRQIKRAMHHSGQQLGYRGENNNAEQSSPEKALCGRLHNRRRTNQKDI